jgi:hypothetical protein
LRGQGLATLGIDDVIVEVAAVRCSPAPGDGVSVTLHVVCSNPDTDFLTFEQPVVVRFKHDGGSWRSDRMKLRGRIHGPGDNRELKFVGTATRDVAIG